MAPGPPVDEDGWKLFQTQFWSNKSYIKELFVLEVQFLLSYTKTTFRTYSILVKVNVFRKSVNLLYSWPSFFYFALTVNIKEKRSRSDAKRTVIWILGITTYCEGNRQAPCSYENWGSYPEQNADSTGHANLTHTHYCHFIPGGLRRTDDQRGDQLLHNWSHSQCCEVKIGELMTECFQLGHVDKKTKKRWWIMKDMET